MSVRTLCADSNCPCLLQSMSPLLAQMRSADRLGQGLLLGSNRKTIARIGFFSV
jgi:hypothetical protein